MLLRQSFENVVSEAVCLWSLTALSTVFSYIMAVNFIGRGVLGENHRPVASHIMLYRAHLAWAGFELTTLVIIGTDCIGSYKSNYHTIMTTMTPHWESNV
jgi:hypothetical protein